MPERPKHPVKELESLLREAEDKGWRVSRGKRYYRLYCPCGEHMKTMHLTPSDPRYRLNFRKWLERQPCWKDEQ